VQKKNPRKLIKNILTDEFSLPERFIEIFLKKIGVKESESFGTCSNEKRKSLIQSLLYYPLEVTSVFGYQKAEVTAGGINLKELNVSTLESKIVEGLYFAGEILDVDGRIGGFNFQWAWSTGAIAGRSAARRALP
jgi:predicted Rossmann fold flavoprotein